MSDVATSPSHTQPPTQPPTNAALPSGLDYELGDEVLADTPARLKALGDPLRMLVLDLVLERAMTVTELATRTNRAKGSVAHHVGVLVDAGLLRVVRTRKVRAVEERFYGRSARTIVFSTGPGEIPFLDDVVAEIDHDRLDADTPSEHATGGFTYRRARVPAERAAEYTRRLYDLTLEFIAEPRAGDTEYGMYIAVFATNRRIAPVDAGDVGDVGDVDVDGDHDDQGEVLPS